MVFTPTNYAPYGSNLSSYPFGVRIAQFDSSIKAASGQIYDNIIVVQVIDSLGNHITTDNST